MISNNKEFSTQANIKQSQDLSTQNTSGHRDTSKDANINQISATPISAENGKKSTVSTGEVPRGELVIRIIAMPRDTNVNGDIFGGWLVSLMDLGASIAAKELCLGRSVTVAINGMVFHHPVHVGDTVSCYAEVLRVGRTSMTINVQAWAMPMDQGRKVKVTEGVFTFVAVDEKGKPRPVYPESANDNRE